MLKIKNIGLTVKLYKNIYADNLVRGEVLYNRGRGHIGIGQTASVIWRVVQLQRLL